MWNWIAPDGSSPATAVPGEQAGTSPMSATEINEQLAQTQQLVTQLKELIREKDQQLQSKEQQLKEEKEASDAKLTKVKLQSKAKVTSLSSQLEELKKQLTPSGSQPKKSEQKKATGDGDNENAAANRGKIVVLRRKIEELESQITQKNEALQTKIAELETQRHRGSEMDAILVEKEKKLSEKEAYIIELQMALGSSSSPIDALTSADDQKPAQDKASMKDSALEDVQIIIQNLTRKVGDSEEKYSLLQEQNESLKILLNKERSHFQEREAMYVENIRMFQNIIQEKEKDLLVQAQTHEHELFKLAAKSDASADLEQLLKALKQKLHEKEEVLLGKTQVIDVLQKELDGKDQQMKEIIERLKRIESEKENLQSKLEAEKHVMRAQLRDMMDKQQSELKLASEKHETEIQEKDQVLFQLKKQVEELCNNGQTVNMEPASKEHIKRLEAQVKLKTEEASKSESKFIKLKALTKSRIKQLEDELKSSASKSNDLSTLSERLSDLENENQQLQTKLEAFSELKTQNEELHAKLVLYEEQQRTLQADLEQVTKRAASQTSDSGSADELQTQVLEWHDMMPGSEETFDQLREEKSAMALRMVQIEEEREAIVSGQQDLEEELASVQGMARLTQARTKGSQISKKPQEDYSYDSQQYEDTNNTLDSVDSAEGENMGGLQTVVEELELERNQLQEQIMSLEERCQGLEDRLQLQVRIETLQNDNERLQTQLMQLRAQFSRETEMHQALSSDLNEQLKGLSDRKMFLENSLVEKEQKLLETTGKLEQINVLKQSFQERDIMCKELSEKLVQIEQQLELSNKKCKSFETECAELKITNIDLTEKCSTLKEKSSKQDLALEVIQHELDQTNEELDRLNTSHLEERSQLIHDLQRCERENDHLKETIDDKEKELASLSVNMTEYSEQLTVLKQQIQYKEEEIREIELNLVKAKREINLLRESQTLDVQESGQKMSALTEKLGHMELELNKTKDQNKVQTEEVKELNRQINECSETIKDLRSQIQTHTVMYHNHVAECEAQILLLKEQVCVSAEKLIESESKHKQETEHLHAQIEESCSSKEKLQNLLDEKESNEQSFERQLKCMKEENNLLISEAAKKAEELVKLSKQFEENIQLQETVKLMQQEKAEAVKLLEDNLQVAKQQTESIKLKFIEKLKTKEKKNRELEKQLKDQSETIDKMEHLKKDLASNIKHLQLTLEEKETSLSDQLKLVSDLTKSITIFQSEQDQMMNEKKIVVKQLEEKESEVSKLVITITELQKKVLANEDQILDYQQNISLFTQEKEELRTKVEHLSLICEEKGNLLASELLEKTEECNILTKQISESNESIHFLREEIHSLASQLTTSKQLEQEKESALNTALLRCDTLDEQFYQSQERIELLQKQIQKLTSDLELMSHTLKEKCTQLEENTCLINKLQNETDWKETELKKLAQWVEERDSTLKQKYAEMENLCELNDKNVKESMLLSSKLEMQSIESNKLKMEKEEVLVQLNNKCNAYESLQTQVTVNNSDKDALKQQLHTLDTENKKLKADLEVTHLTLTKKTEEITILSSHLSQQAHTVLALKDQVDNIVIEKQKLQTCIDEKEVTLVQKDTFIQEMKESKLKEQGLSAHIILDLQNQLQNFTSETAQLRQTIQIKDNELNRQSQEIKAYKDKSEESELFKVQLSENMEIISDLHFQIKNLSEKTEELNQLVLKKDESLREKTDDYVNLKIKYSEIEEISGFQQKQIETLLSEINQMKSNILEQDNLLQNTLSYSEELKLKLQDKEIACGSLRQKVKNLELENIELNNIKVSVVEKDNYLVEKENLIKNLNDKLIKDEMCNSQLEKHILLVSQLEGKVHTLTNELMSSKELINEKENAFIEIKKQCAIYYEQINLLNETLGEKQNYISELLKSLNEKDSNIVVTRGDVFALQNEIKLLQEELEKNVVILKNMKNVVEEKQEIISVKQRTIDSLTVDLQSVRLECTKNVDKLGSLETEIQQKVLTVQSLQEKCLEQSQHIEQLKSDMKNLDLVSSQNIYDKTLLIENLQLQLADVVKGKYLLQEDIKNMMLENENSTSFQKQLEEESEELKERNKNVEHSYKESQVELNAVILQLKNEKEHLLKQVSVNVEEISALNLKLENLQLNICESEGKLKVEHVSISQQNDLLRDRLNYLESELISRDDEIKLLQQYFCLIDEKINCQLFSGEELNIVSSVTPGIDNLLIENHGRIDKLSLIISKYMALEKELELLKSKLSVKESECVDFLEERLKNKTLQDDIERLRENDQSQITCLLLEIESNKGKFHEQQSLLQKKEQMESTLNTNIMVLQEQMACTMKELQNHSESLKAERNKVLNLIEEISNKEDLIQSLKTQVNQQKDLISALSVQLKEKDVSVSQVMESMSNEILRFSEEKSIFINSLQNLESIQKSSVTDLKEVSQNLEECKEELENYKGMLMEKEAVLTDVINEKGQLQVNLDKIGKEKDVLKKKLQASLVVRRDLLQKSELLEKTGQDIVAKEKNKIEELLTTVDELRSHLELAEKHKKEIESHLKLLKCQLLEKDNDVNNLSEILAAKESLLEQCQKNIQHLNNVLAQKDDQLHEYLKCIQQKDILLNMVQTDVNKGESILEDHSREISDLVHFSLKEDMEKGPPIGLELPAVNGGGDATDIYSQVSQQIHIQKENEILPNKLDRSPIQSKETSTKSLNDNDRHFDFDDPNQIKQLEHLQEEHSKLQDIFQQKCKECESNCVHILLLQEEIKSCKTILLEKEQNMDQLILQHEEKQNKMKATFQEDTSAYSKRIEELMVEITRREMQVNDLNSKYSEVLKASEILEQNVNKTSSEMSEKIKEIAMLKYSMKNLEQQKQDEEILMTKIGHLDKMAVASAVHAAMTDIEPGISVKEQETLLGTHSNKHKVILDSTSNLKKYIKPQSNEILEPVIEEIKVEDCGTRSTYVDSEIISLNTQEIHGAMESKQLLHMTRNPKDKAVIDKLSHFQKEQEQLQLDNLMSQMEILKKNLNEKEKYVQAHQHECSQKDRHIVTLENQIEQLNRNIPEVENKTLQHSNTIEGHDGTHFESNSGQQKDIKINGGHKSIEHLQRKLHAALLSRKDVLKENKSLKEKMDCLNLEKSKLFDKVSSLELSLADLDKYIQNTEMISSLNREKDSLISENQRLLSENENLSAACESLKSTMETIVQEKEAFSVQLNSLQESKMVELSDWKAKHNELNKEYDSLLQAYENISDEIDKMRQIIELTRKEKHDVVHKVIELESQKLELEKCIRISNQENDNLNIRLEKLTTEDQFSVSELTVENANLLKENNILKEIHEDLQSKMELHKSGLLSKLDDICNEKESLLRQITSMTNDISDKMEYITTVEKEKNIAFEKCKEAEESKNAKSLLNIKLENELQHFKQHILSLNENVRILEDDKCLLQEELENIQEHSDKVKYEKEFLETEILNNIKQIDQLTDKLNSIQLQNSSLREELEHLKAEKCSVVNETKEQQFQMAKEFEEKVKEASRNNSEAKNTSKELKDLLKEKQHEIHQLQKDSIRFQELILELERNAKLAQSKSEKCELDLKASAEALTKSRADEQIINEKVKSYINLLNDTQSENSSLTAKITKMQREIESNKEQYELQIIELENRLQSMTEEFQALQQKYTALSQEQNRLVYKLEEMKNEMSIKESNNKTLQSDLNANMARLAAFSQYMLSFQNNRDQVFDEVKIWENQFKDAIQNKESQVEDSNLKMMLLQGELNKKVTQIRELQMKYSVLEQENNVLTPPIPNEYKRHIEELEKKLNTLQVEKEQSHESYRTVVHEIKNLLLKSDKACQEKSEIAIEIEALKKSVSSLKSEENDTIEEAKGLQQKSGQNEILSVESIIKNIDLKQEVRNLLNEMDDLHSENAMLRAQLIRYREDLNQVLSLKDHQLKELLKQQLEHIKILEQEKSALQRENKEFKRLNILLKEKMEVLELENAKVLTKMNDLESLIATLNKEIIVSKSKVKTEKGVNNDQGQPAVTFKIQAVDEHGETVKQGDKSNNAEDVHKLLSIQRNVDVPQHDSDTLEHTNEKWMLEVKKQNADLKSQNESFAKTMAALQNDRDGLIEDFKVLQCKYASELKSEQMRAEKLEAKLNDVNCRLIAVVEGSDFRDVSATEDKDLLALLDSGIKGLCGKLSNREREITRLSSECVNYSQQIDAFSKAMASLQDDRDRLLEQVNRTKNVYETKQGITSITMPSDTNSNRNIVLQSDRGTLDYDMSSQASTELEQLKFRVNDLERALQTAKATQERTDKEITAYQTELTKLRAENDSLVTENLGLQDQCEWDNAEKDRQIAELQSFHKIIISKESTSTTNVCAIKQAQEISALVGSGNVPDQVKQLLSENRQLKEQVQRCLQEMGENGQFLQLTKTREDMRIEVPPGAPQEKASDLVEIDRMELRKLRKRLADIEDQYDFAQQNVTYLAESLEEERTLREAASKDVTELEERLEQERARRQAAEDALGIDEDQDISFDHAPREYEHVIQMESDDERQALILDPRQHTVVRKMKGGALSVRRWLRGRSMYCAKLLTSKAKSRYIFLSYLIVLHIVVVMFLARIL